MQPEYMTLADPSLDHQVIFFMVKERVHISCNCLRKKNGGNTSMRQVDGDIVYSRYLYNDAKNHSKPFGKDDEAKW